MAQRLAKESAGLPAEVIIIIIIFFIIIFILGGGSISGIFDLFKGILTIIIIWMLRGMKIILQ